MLNEFRTQKFTWDKATNKFHKTVRIASTDEHGRKLVVQIINNGQIEDLSSVLLNLYWETKDKAHKGLDAFTPIDASQGLFEIYYTTEMLSNIGELKANLYLVDQGAITSEPFILNVFEGIDTEAVESDDSFTALAEALLRVQEIETQEQERKDAEEARKTAEATRESNESTRKSNETSRKSAETNRASAETSRVDNETARVTAESGRVSAESTRVTNENTRKTNENNRKSAETSRESAEANRQATFEANETARENQYQDLVASVEGIEDDYIPRLTKVESKTKDTTYLVTNDTIDFKKTPTVNGKPLLWFGTVEEI